MDSKFLGEKIKISIKDAGYNYAEIAEKTGFHINTIGNWARGKTQPSIEELSRLAEITQKKVSWFFENDNVNSKIENIKTQEKCVQKDYSKNIFIDKVDKILEGITMSENIVNRFLTVIENQQKQINEQIAISKQYANQLKDQQEITKNLSEVLSKQNTSNVIHTPGKELSHEIGDNTQQRVKRAPQHLKSHNHAVH